VTDPPAGDTIGINGMDHVTIRGLSADQDIPTAGASGAFKPEALATCLDEISQFLKGDMFGNAGTDFGAHSTIGYSGNNQDAGGALTRTDGSAQRLALLGQYAAASFVSDGAGRTLITHPPELVAEAQLVKPHG
jgi:hypothetical protein